MEATKVFDAKAQAEQLQSPGLMETLQRPGLAEVLQDLDDETLRRIFKMPPLLMVGDPRRDEGQLAVEHPSNLRQGEGEPAADMLLQMEGEMCYERGPGIDVSVKDLAVV